MKTIILMWNPGISSYKMDLFEDELESLGNEWGTEYNWSIHYKDELEYYEEKVQELKNIIKRRRY